MGCTTRWTSGRSLSACRTQGNGIRPNCGCRSSPSPILRQGRLQPREPPLPDPAPDGTLPGPGNSFYCVRKGFIDRVVLVNNSTPPVTQPPGVVPSGDIADEPAPTPGASPLGLGVVGAIMLLSGAWIIYRKRASATA